MDSYVVGSDGLEYVMSNLDFCFLVGIGGFFDNCLMNCVNGVESGDSCDMNCVVCEING